MRDASFKRENNRSPKIASFDFPDLIDDCFYTTLQLADLYADQIIAFDLYTIVHCTIVHQFGGHHAQLINQNNLKTNLNRIFLLLIVRMLLVVTKVNNLHL